MGHVYEVAAGAVVKLGSCALLDSGHSGFVGYFIECR